MEIVAEKDSLDAALAGMSFLDLVEVLAHQDGYSEVPVDIDTFIDDDYYLGHLYGGLNEKGEPRVYPFWREQLRDIYPNPFDSPYEQICITGAIGIGKTTTAIVGSIYDLYRVVLLISPHEKFSLIKTTIIAFAFFTATKELGGAVLATQISDVIETSPFFKSKLDPKKDGVLFPNKIGVVYGSRFGHALGMAIIAAIMDETNFQKSVHNQALNNYNNILRRMKSRFLEKGGTLPCRFWLLSSKNDDSSFLEVHIDKNRHDPKTKIIEVALWEVHSFKGIYCGETFKVFVGDEGKDPFIVGDRLPSYLDEERVFDVPIEYKKDFLDDIAGALRDIAGVSTISTFKIFRSVERFIKALILPHFFSMETLRLTEHEEDQVSDFLNMIYLDSIKNRSEPRFVHCDLAVNGDKAGIAMCHASGSKVMQKLNTATGLHDKFEEHIVRHDFLLSVKAMAGQEIPFSKLRAFIVFLRNSLGFNIVLVSTDGFQSVEFRQMLRQQGFNTELLSVDKIKDPYLAWKRAVLEGRNYLPKLELLKHEMKYLEDTGKKIDHPEGKDGHGKEYSKDLADAAAGSFWACTTMAVTNTLGNANLIEQMEAKMGHNNIFQNLGGS